ncbi:MAG: insulinase family protein [Rhodospirillales bacterium]|nr:insulinase family protein [Rhodospirillales bacterium]MCW8951464.1 insulinase family protein [Rhodospirillales bacterium]MCW8970876.1 insulinase family protein [Rhodospirillales bacterium]MCW9001686.1 insulinase family protein [Rhodospirillales bacterium]
MKIRLFAIFFLFVALALAPHAHARPDVQRVISPGGIEAWLVEDHANPIIAVSFSFRGGTALDPNGKEGLADMVSALLDEGAGDIDSEGFQRRLEDLSISLRFEAGLDTFGGRLQTLTDNRDEAFGLLSLAVTKPRFDEEPVSRIRSQILANLRMAEEDPDKVASETLFAKLFPGHPYGRRAEGTAESVAGLHVEDMKGFVARRLARDNLIVGVVGDIKAEDLGPLLDRTFGGLPQKAAAWNTPDIKANADGKLTVVSKAVPQSAIVFAQPGLKRKDPDFYAAYVMNYVLGGGSFASRLYKQIREERGLAYSVYSYLYPMDHAALLTGGAGTANARVGETLSVLRDEWRKMAEKGVTAEELADAKTYLTGSFPLRFDSSLSIARILVGMQEDDLGIDFLDRRNDMIEAVTLEQVNRVAKTLLDPSKLSIVVVGEPEGVETGK